MNSGTTYRKNLKRGSTSAADAYVQGVLDGSITAGRLVQVVKAPQGQPSMTTAYAYDLNGNRLSKTEPAEHLASIGHLLCRSHSARGGLGID